MASIFRVETENADDTSIPDLGGVKVKLSL
jgi:hypothetical protein